MALSRIPNPIYPYAYTINQAEIGVRDLILLTLGATEHTITYDRLHILSITFSEWLKQDLNASIKKKIIFNKMLKKLENQAIIHQRYDEASKRYLLSLTPFGHGELDSLLFSSTYIEKKWNSFRQLALLATS